jgi:hypothetical protein
MTFGVDPATNIFAYIRSEGENNTLHWENLSTGEQGRRPFPSVEGSALTARPEGPWVVANKTHLTWLGPDATPLHSWQSAGATYQVFLSPEASHAYAFSHAGLHVLSEDGSDRLIQIPRAKPDYLDLPRGRVLFKGYQDVIVEVDLKNGEIQREWSYTGQFCGTDGQRVAILKPRTEDTEGRPLVVYELGD